jgi:formate hydrogenlyase subunit 3/multisubunit Na+/H+ antiporter MnhD subunit
MNLSPEFFRVDNLSIFIGIFIALFTLLAVIYSFGFMRGRKRLVSYYFYIILTLVSSFGAVFSNNLVLLIVFWGFLGVLLYLLIGFGEKESTTQTAKKAFIIVGGADALMLLGLALVWRLTGTLQMDKLSIMLNSEQAVWAYLLLAMGAFAKAGAMPLHTWVPDTAEDAPTPVAAFLPASLDKLLGIYFLARITLDMFVMNVGMNIFLMALGSFTIVAAVMMALVQHDLKRLLGYHAVSQVGYMVLGIGTGNPIGIAGGLFHMLNNAIYKSGLFFGGGAVEKKTGTTDLDKLGGLGRFMPVTFIAFLIASFAISGVPPLNGFASKWMVYQGIIDTAKSGGRLWIVWLVAAMVGSALTLASFMKLVHSIFLGQPSRDQKFKEVSPTMWIPPVILAGLCIVFGIFVYRIPMRFFIGPSVQGAINYTGIWGAGLATILILIGIAVGVLIYFLGTIKKTRETEAFIGGEVLKNYRNMRVSGTEFYDTIKDLGLLKTIYQKAKDKFFDIYDQGTKFTLFFTKILRRLHSGILPVYLIWCLLGLVILLFILFRGSM